MTYFIITHILTAIGLIYGYLGNERGLLPKKPNKFQTYAEDGILADLTYSSKMSTYSNELRRIKDSALRGIKISIPYLFIPLISLFIDMGVEKFWWYDVSVINNLLICVFIPTSMIYLNSIVYIVFYVKLSEGISDTN